jgi:hypothetical protein
MMDIIIARVVVWGKPLSKTTLAGFSILDISSVRSIEGELA